MRDGNRITQTKDIYKSLQVYGTSRNPEKSKESLSFPLIALDVTNSESITAAIATLLQKESRIDILINNAGMGITGPMEETPTDAMRKVFDTNFYGPLEVIKAVLPQRRLQRSGLIVNITSIAGYMGLPYRGIYSATKAALAVTTESYRMEIKAFGITMANLAPGDFATNIAAGRYHAPVIKDSPYAAQYEEALTMMDGHVKEGNDPIEVAKAVEKIIITSHPRVHYKVGSLLQKFSVFLKSILPSKAYEKMLMKHFRKSINLPPVPFN